MNVRTRSAHKPPPESLDRFSVPMIVRPRVVLECFWSWSGTWYLRAQDLLALVEQDVAFAEAADVLAQQQLLDEVVPIRYRFP